MSAKVKGEQSLRASRFFAWLVEHGVQAAMDAVGWLALVQGLYFATTGAWPVLHMRSFEAITGPKTDRWLVQMVGLLAVSIGGPLVVAGTGGQIGASLAQVALFSAIAFLAIDVAYVARRTIRPIYLGDAVLEVAFIAAWAALWPS